MSEIASILKYLLRSRVLPLLFITLLSPSLLAANPDPRELINAMTQALEQRNYDGTFVYLKENRLTTLRIIHRFDNGNQNERLISLTGIGGEVIRDNQTVTCILPERHSVMMEPSRPRNVFPTINQQALDRLASYYLFRLVGRDRVANRTAWVVNIEPKGRYRYTYRYWIDVDSKLLLRTSLMNHHGKVLEQIMFTNIDLPESIPDRMLQPVTKGIGHTWQTHWGEDAAIETANDKLKWRIGWLPQGFELKNSELRTTSRSPVPIEHMVFSDGLAMVSVFVERLQDGTPRMEGFTLMGGVSTYSMVKAGYQITVLGEVPAITVRQMASSLQPPVTLH